MSNSWEWPGARWWKFDFHTHTPASVEYGKGPDQCQLRRITPEAWLLGFMRAEVDCVAVTDHNTGEWIDRLKVALQELEQNDHPEFRPLYLFPGVELSINSGFHLLALLDTHRGTSDIDTLLGLVEYVGNKGNSDDVTTKSAIEVVEAVLSAGAIPIPAHSDGPKGLLRLVDDEESLRTVLDPNTIRQVLDSTGILAMEVTDPDSDKPAIYLELNPMWPRFLDRTRIIHPMDLEQIFLAHTTRGSRWRSRPSKDCAWRCWTEEGFRSDEVTSRNTSIHLDYRCIL